MAGSLRIAVQKHEYPADFREILRIIVGEIEALRNSELQHLAVQPQLTYAV